MREIKRLTALTCVCLLLSPVSPVFARTKAGDRYLAQGRLAEQATAYEKALELYELALREDPSDIAYQLGAWRLRFQVSQALVDRGQKLRNEGKLEEALTQFQKAFAISPASSIADQEIRRTRLMIEREKAKAGQPGAQVPLPEERGLTAGEQARREADERIASVRSVPVLKPISPQIQSLRINNQPVRVMFETVGKLAGINVIFDPEYQVQSRNFSLDLTNTTLEDALEHVSMLTKSYWKPLSENTIFVTNDNVTKRRDYEDHVVKVFYLRNVTTVQELQEISTVIRTLTDIRRLFPYNAQNAILARGTVDQVTLAEKLLQDLDKPKSEVVVDVIVMEASTARTRELAATILSGGTPGLTVGIAFTGGTTTGGGNNNGDNNNGSSGSGSSSGSVPIARLGNLSANDWSVTLPGAVLSAVMSDRGTRIRQSPQVRAVENQKASMRIGDRVPTATGSFQPGIGTVGVSPLVNTQFQFVEVGVNVDLVPKVHGADEVSLHVELEISSVKDRIDLGGILQPIIGQRKVVHDLRIREGEISLLGGLLLEQDTKTVGGVPGLMNIPIIGKLFSSESIDRSSGELLIALVPHVVRSPDLTPVNLRGISAGNDQTVKLSYASRPAEEPPPAKPSSQPVPAPAKPSGVPAPAVPIPGAVPAGQSPIPPALRLQMAPAEVRAGGSITVTLQMDGATDLFSAPGRIQFDPKLMRLVSMKPGGLLSSDGQQVNFTEDTRNDAGEAAFTLNRLPGSGGVNGTGALVTFVFQALAPGEAKVRITEISPRNSKLETVALPAPEVDVTIR